MSFGKWVLAAAVLFGLGMALGVAMPPAITGLLSEDVESLRNLAQLLKPFQFSTFVFIFLKNVSAVLISFLFSPFLLVMPVLALLFNGWLLSFVAVTVARQESLGLVLLAILPHGVLELPALVIGEAAALSFGAVAIKAALSRQSSLLVSGFRRNLRYLVISAALLLPAALIETYVTPLLLR
ncbi:MAG: stage II sporulation protein M [Chloroflexi bacterium]|nr:stage II sporulation protein M [Chloroflexota bacterium]